jgi:hypothetical protein
MDAPRPNGMSLAWRSASSSFSALNTMATGPNSSWRYTARLSAVVLEDSGPRNVLGSVGSPDLTAPIAAVSFSTRST